MFPLHFHLPACALIKLPWTIVSPLPPLASLFRLVAAAWRRVCARAGAGPRPPDWAAKSRRLRAPPPAGGAAAISMQHGTHARNPFRPGFAWLRHATPACSPLASPRLRPGRLMRRDMILSYLILHIAAVQACVPRRCARASEPALAQHPDACTLSNTALRPRRMTLAADALGGNPTLPPFYSCAPLRHAPPCPFLALQVARHPPAACAIARNAATQHRTPATNSLTAARARAPAPPSCRPPPGFAPFTSRVGGGTAAS